MSISLTVDRKASSKSFTKVPNHIINDSNLSFKAKGLISVLLSLPPDYPYLSVEGLAKKHNTGTSAIRSGLQELTAAGYLRVNRKYDVSRQFAGYTWYLSDLPEGREIPGLNHVKPNVENPHADRPASENTELINTKTTKKLEIKKTTTSPVGASALEYQGLRITAPMLTETRDQVYKALDQVAPADRQKMLDELSAAIKSGAIKTTAIRWFHGVIKRYREGEYNFKPAVPQAASQDPSGLASTHPQDPFESATRSVKNKQPSSVGLQHLSRLKKRRGSLNSTMECHLTDGGHTSDQDQQDAEDMV